MNNGILSTNYLWHDIYFVHDKLPKLV